jgi:hypothetical protein
VEDLDIARSDHQLKTIKSMQGPEEALPVPDVAKREMDGMKVTVTHERLHSHKPQGVINA